MKAAGWMIFIGDMLHNFIDGLTLGAAFMVSIGEGLRLSFPIMCEEFPHELGDIAVLLSSGLTIGQALIMNFLSACSCYLGFIIGAKLGRIESFIDYVNCRSLSRRIGRISSMDLCIGRRHVRLHRSR
jgi:zinc transporter ZupT